MILTRKTALLALVLSLSAVPVLAAETRCGWLQNPTPSNWWLDDRDASWTIMTQGDIEPPPGMDLIPDISAGDYVMTNGYYGYACACMSVEVNKTREQIIEILSVKQLSIAKCENDPALNPPQ